jgi:hypothetical protein
MQKSTTRLAFGIRNATAKEAMQRDILLGATLGSMRGPSGMPGTNLFANEPALWAQLTPPKATARQPERRLMLAVLENAIEDVVTSRRGTGVNAERLRADALAWMDGDSPDWWPFSFGNICETLEINGAAIRRRLQRVEPQIVVRKRSHGQHPMRGALG